MRCAEGESGVRRAREPVWVVKRIGVEGGVEEGEGEGGGSMVMVVG